MKKAKVLLFLLTCAYATIAQKAPDFSILDYNNETHQLYKDYLDEGKVVMLKIMFVACPPCNNVAPSIQDLYEEFGEGMDDVQFLELSNKSWDDNAAMKGFGEKHSLTFPGAGADGGSLSAVSPYTSGTYGRFLGTPTFVVIDPDGNVNFNVPMQDLRNAIDEAMGGSGCANRFGGTIDTPNDSADVLLKSDIVGATTFVLDLNSQNEYEYECQFTFPPQSFDYYLTVEQDGNDIAGVTIKDIVMLLRHLLAITPLTSTEQKIAADFTANGVLSVRDISEIRKLVLGTYGENPHHNSWIFFHEDSDFSQDSSGILIPDLIQTVPLMDVVDSIVTGNFTGIKLGDVSGDINPFFNKNVTRSISTLDLKYDNSMLLAGNEVRTSLELESGLTGLQFSLKLSGSVEDIAIAGMDQVHWSQNGDEVRILAYSNEFSADHINQAVEIIWTPNENGMTNHLLQLTNVIPPIGIEQDDEYRLRMKTSEDMDSWTIWPNPTDQDRVWISLSEDIASIEIMTIDGRLLQKKGRLDAGSHELKLGSAEKGMLVMVTTDFHGNKSYKQLLRN